MSIDKEPAEGRRVAKCGTYSGAQAHQRKGETPCDACRKARTAYMREHRATNKGYRDQNRARSRALWRLADRHREEFERLYVEERTREHVERMAGGAS